MTNKGFTLIELLIVIVVLSIVSAFSIVAISEIIENARQNSFVVSANTFLNAAQSSYQQGDSIWDDNTATLAEIIDAGYVEIGLKDPWNGEYDFNESYVIVDDSSGLFNKLYLSISPFNYDFLLANETISFRIKLVSTTAIIGYDDALAEVSREDIVFLDDSNNSLYTKIVSVFDNSLSENLTTDNSDDEINVTEDIGSGSVIETLDGDDTLTIGDDIKRESSVDMGEGDDTLNIGDDIRHGSSIDMGEGNDTLNIGDDIKDKSSIDTGAGDDTVTVNGEIKGGSSIDTGDGNDTVLINDDIQDDATVNTGTGDDTVTVNDDVQSGAILNTGSGNDTVTVNDDLDNATILTGLGEDNVTIVHLITNSTIDTGADDDTVYLEDVGNNYNGETTLGSGNDTLTIIDNTGWGRDLKRTVGTFDGGEGDDILYLPNITLSQWNDYVSVLFFNFETVVLEDVTINP